MRLALVVCALLAGCATAPAPLVHTAEFPVGDWTPSWFGDGDPKVLVVYNDDSRPLHVDIHCFSSSSYRGSGDWEADVKAHGELRALIQTLNRNRFVNVCKPTGWRTIDHLRHGMRRRSSS